MQAHQVLLAAVISGSMTSVTLAATWTGGTSTLWDVAGNWTSPGAVPNTSQPAIFDGVPTANQPNLNGSDRSPGSLAFNTAGWTVTTGTFTMRTWGGLVSSGAGVNTINGNLGVSGSSGTPHLLQIDAGNTLNVTGNAAWGGAASYVGPGTLVIGGHATLFPTSTPFDLYVNGTTVVPGTFSMASGRTFGGMSNLAIQGFGSPALGAGAAYSPGYDSINPYASVTLTGFGNTAGFNLSNAKLIMDIGTSLGVNDQVVAGASLTRSNGLNITGAELALRGTTIEDGAYTLLVESSGTITGTFGSITFNGVTADPANFSLTYNAGNSSIVLNVVGMNVPEPTSIAFLGLGGLLLGRRRLNRE